MQIILVSDRLASTRTLTISRWHVVVASFGLLLLVLGLSTLFSFVTLKHAVDMKLPIVQDILAVQRAEESAKAQQVVRDNINAMAVRLGQMQAQLIQLDMLGTRVAGMAGLKLPSAKSQSNPGQGGPQVEPTRQISPDEMMRMLDALSEQVDAKSDILGLMESDLIEEKARLRLLPSSLPLTSDWNASTFGWRIDPFSGHKAFHEGVDFVADTGAPVMSAAAGVVIFAGVHPTYGNLVEVDHGNGITTRYAHTSRMMVSVGAVVKRGQKIAEVGSTGRSTGPHLHFEVRYQGVAQNPNRFLLRARDAQLALSR